MRIPQLQFLCDYYRNGWSVSGPHLYSNMIWARRGAHSASVDAKNAPHLLRMFWNRGLIRYIKGH